MEISLNRYEKHKIGLTHPCFITPTLLPKRPSPDLGEYLFAHWPVDSGWFSAVEETKLEARQLLRQLLEDSRDLLKEL